MREHDGRDIGRHVPEGSKIRLEPALETRQSGVDRGQPAALFNQVPVDERDTETVDAGNDVWRRIDVEILFTRARI
jgi:hypothetical protein